MRMEQGNIVYYPVVIDFDSHPLNIKPNSGRMVKGTRILINRNSTQDTTSGTGGVITPVESNEIYCEGFYLPEGENKTIGAFENRELNEIYWLVWNSNNDFTVNFIDGETETCTTVYKGSCLNFSLLPEHGIPEHRCYVRIQYTEIDGVQIIKEKYFIFIDGYGNVRQINVLASIGSNSFTTAYFAPVYPHYETCSFITLAPIAPMYKPTYFLLQRTLDPVTGRATDADVPNKMFNKSFQFAYRFHYVDGRESSISPYSSPVIIGGTSCDQQNPEYLPRCTYLYFWAGNAFVDKIDIFYRECTTCLVGTCNGNWVKVDTISKFDCDENINWWERDIELQWANNQPYNSYTNVISYLFCNDKACDIVDQAIFEHIENLVPFKSKALAPIGDRLGLANNLRGSENMTCDEVDSFTIDVEAQEGDGCDVTLRDIKVYAILRNQTTDDDGNGEENQFVWGKSNGGDASINGRFYWGGFGYRNPPSGSMRVCVDGHSGWDSWQDYQQYVPEKIGDETGGFVGYFAGTDIAVVSKQVKLTSGNCNVEQLGIIYRDLTAMYNTNGSFDDVVEALANGEYIILQEFHFKQVPAGKYVFRIGGHREGMSSGYQQTSTYTYSYNSITPCSPPSGTTQVDAVINDYEWTIDVCEHDYNSLYQGKFILVTDCTRPDFDAAFNGLNTNNKWHYCLISEFYLYEDSLYTIPFEKQPYRLDFGYYTTLATGNVHDLEGTKDVCNPWFPFDLSYNGSGIDEDTFRVTDHNGFGFYREMFWRRKQVCGGSWLWFYSEPVLGRVVLGYKNKCANAELPSFVVGISQVIPNVNNSHQQGSRGLKGTVKKSTNTNANLCNRVSIKGTITDTDGNALSGVTVGYTESQFARTDGFGKFNITAHQNYANNRTGYFLVSNTGNSCVLVCVDSCTLCCDDTYQSVTLPACTDCTANVVTLTTIQLKQINLPDRGLKGSYYFAVEGWDLYGRLVTGGANVIVHKNIDQCWSKHPLINWSQDGTAMNTEIQYITFSRTQNLDGSILQWVADKFYLLDKDGNKTNSKSNAIAVAVDINSLLQYNVAHNLGTLVNYQFVKGDLLRIIDDCSVPVDYIITGSTFGHVDINALTEELTVSNTSGDTATTKKNFATDNGATIIIPYDSRIDDLLLKCSVKIEIVRPFACESNIKPYGEVSDVIPVVDGVLLSTSGVIDTWDIYKIYRNIPKNITCDTNPNFLSYFSQNITDFWGENCTDFGRKLIENPYAQRKWNENELAVSYEWVNNGVINGLSTFWNENVKNFKGQNWGGIQAMNSQRGAIIFICTNDWFLTSYDQNYLQVNSNGVVTATLPDKISDPHQRIGQNYGVSEEHTSSVIFFDGMIQWFDGKNGAIIGCDYQSAKDITEGAIKGWTLDKSMFIQNYNANHSTDRNFERMLYEVVAGICPLYKEYHLTIRPRKNLSSDVNDFINHERDLALSEGETMVYNNQVGAWVNMRAYTAEYYGKLRTSKSGMQFISFVNGLPYRHNNNNTDYSTFYGVKTTPVIEISVNHMMDKVKIIGAITEEIQPFALFVDRIITEEKNSYSYIPQGYFVRKENIQYAQFLCDMSSYFDPNIPKNSMLIDGKRMFGRYALVRLVANEANQNQYFQLAKILCLISNSELSAKSDSQK